MKIDGSLSIEPELRGRSKRRPEFERHFSRHRRPCVHDAIDNFDVAADVGRQRLLSHADRSKKFLPQNLTRSRWLSLITHAVPSLEFPHYRSSLTTLTTCSTASSFSAP